MAGTEDFITNVGQAISPYVDDNSVFVGGPGTLDFGPFTIGAWPSLMLRIMFTIGDGRCGVTWSDSPSGGIELSQQFYVREDDIGVFVVPNYGGAIPLIQVETTQANCQIWTYAIGTNQIVPGVQTPNGDILAFDDTVAPGAGATATIDIPPYAGPAQLHFDAALYPWQVSVFGTDEAGATISRAYRIAAAAADVNTEIWLPPHINAISLTDNTVGSNGRVSLIARR